MLDRLSKLKPFKAPGPDELHSYILRECSSSIYKPLCMLFNQSLQCGQLPHDWKCANVIPVFKKGSKFAANNYRPISLTSQIVKILEYIVCDNIHKYFADNNFIHPPQHGFVPRKSCLTNLLESFQAWIQSVDDGFGVDIIFLDYKKAFDSVPHRRLLLKLEGYGISGNLLSWITDFLYQRLQRVTVDGTHSKWCRVMSGVPQGSVLGLLLFVIYINDLSENIDCNIKQYADDTKLYAIIKNDNDIVQMQHDLDITAEWSNAWQLSFSFDKCKHMQVGNFLAVDYNLMDHSCGERKVIKHVAEEKDLGIWCTANLKPTAQCRSAVSKAMKALGLIKRTFKYFNAKSLPKLYKTYVRPHLEFCVQVWSPYLVGDIDALEKVQRRATKLIPGLSNLPYEERLKILHLHSLYARRLRGDLILTYRILNGLISISSDDLFTLNTNSRTRGHNLKLYKKRSRLNISKYFFSNRVVSCWNSLPDYVISADTINSFKNRLDNFWNVTGHGYQQRPLA